MARSTSTFDFPSNFEVKTSAPRPTRFKNRHAGSGAVNLQLDTIQILGMVVSVTGDTDHTNNGVYVLVTNGATSISDWKRIDVDTYSKGKHWKSGVFWFVVYYRSVVGTDVSSRTPAREHSIAIGHRAIYSYSSRTRTRPLLALLRGRTRPVLEPDRARTRKKKGTTRPLLVPGCVPTRPWASLKNLYSPVGGYGPGAVSGTYEYGKCPLPSLTRSRTRT